MKKTAFVMLLCAGLCFASSGQEKPVRYSIRLGYSRLNNIAGWKFQQGNIGELKIEGNGNINKFLDAGVYAGFSNTHMRRAADGDTFIGYKNYGVYLYGVNAGFHILPLFIPPSRLDVYIAGKLGGYHVGTVNRSGITANLGMGVSYIMHERFGVFAEYGFGFGEGKYRDVNYMDKLDTRTRRHIPSARFGISYRF
jgi:hypothetical protein